MSELLAELAAAGEVAARGGFTIDPEKAREKLRQYQLADPRRYVLLLVEAAVSCGASKLEFEIDSDDLHLRFDGATFSYAQLENIYGSLFSSVSGELAVEELARLHGLKQLAFALNSAMALNPRYVRIVSVGEDGAGTRLELRPDTPDQIEQITGGEAPGNWVHVKDRFRPGLVVEFFRSLRGNLVEINLIREHCRWSRTPVLVNGEAINRPLEFTGKLWTSVDVLDRETGAKIGVAALGLEDEQGRFNDPHAYLLANGVFIEEVALLGGLAGFAAIVDSPRFGKDVSQTKLLRDAGFDTVIEAIMVAQARAVARLAERCKAGTAPSWAIDTLLVWLCSGKFGGLRKLLREDEVFAVVADAPVWPVIGAANISTRTLIESDGPIRYANKDFEFAPVDVPFVLALAHDDARLRARTLDKLFPSRTEDYTPALDREWERQRNRLEFMTRRHLPELPEGYYPIRETIGAVKSARGTATIHGELGLRSLGQRDGWIRLVHEGCLLQEVRIDHPLPGLYAVVQTELEPTHSYDEARPTTALAEALVAILEALLRAMTGLAASGAVAAQHTELRELVRSWIIDVMQPDYAIRLLSNFGFVRGLARRELDNLLDKDQSSIRPIWNLDAPPGSRHPLAEVPLFARVNRGPRSLAELRAHVVEGRRLLWLEPWPGALPLLDEDVLLLDKRERELLRSLLGADVLEPFAEQLARLRRRDAFLERPKAKLVLSQATIVRAAVRTEGLRGELGLREFGFGDVGNGHCPVRVLYRERDLCELSLELPLPGLVAWVESDAFELTNEFNGLAHPLELRAPLLHAAVGLVEQLIGRALREPRDLRRCEWWLLTMIPNEVFGDSGLSGAFMRLCVARGGEQALIDLDLLLALHERFPGHDVDRAIGRLRGRDELPTPEAVEAQLRRPTRRLTDAEREVIVFRRALVAVLGPVLELPLLRRFSGRAVDGTTPRTITLASLYASVASGEPVSWVGEEFSLSDMPKLDFDVVGLDPIEQQLLQSQLGVDGLELVTQWLHGRAQFERRRTISDVRVPRGGVLSVVEVSGNGWRGELGIVRDSPRNVQRSKIRVFTANREAAVVDLPAKPIPVIGALAFDELELNDRFDDVVPAERERVRGLVQARIDELLVDLAARYHELARNERPRAAEIVRYLLATWPPGTGGYTARSRKRAKLFRALAELPVFAGARKPWSAVELAEASERGPISTIAYRRDIRLPDTPIVLLDTDDVQSTLEALFGPTRDYYAELEREHQLAARKAAAARLPSEPPIAALAQLEIRSERLTGLLWITSSREQVQFGAEGRVISAREVVAFCWCGGAITGEGLNISSDWSRVVLSRSQERMLERSALDMWTSLVEEFLQMSSAEAPRSRAERQRFVSTRDALTSVFLNLHGAFGQGRGGETQSRKRKRGNRFERLYERTREAPLLELRNGRWISADVAARERPIELASLGLWTGPSAEEVAHQRAVERREAERARQAELEEQRQAEAERRRQAALAREREAARRREAKRQAELEASEREARAAREREAIEARDREARARKALAATPERLLLEAIREELRLVRAENRGLLSNRILDSLVIGAPVRRGPLLRHADGKTELDPDHRLFQAALRGYLDDPTLVTLLASAAYTYLNIVHVEITDADEAEYLRLHAGHAVTSCASED